MAVTIPPFVPPDFLQNQDVGTIHQRMRDQAPADLDKSEGSLFWDLTRPVAIEKSEMVEFAILRTLQLMFPQFAEGVYLDYHGQTVGVTRLPATRASGTVTITGSPGTTIPEGTIVSTVASEDSPSIQFVTTEEVTIDETGNVEVEIEAVEPGTLGNVPAGAIQVLGTTISGVESVTNTSATSGGTNEEDDEAFRYRILERNQNKSMSGSKQDYIRWAMEVPGVGSVEVLPEWNGPGTVKLLVMDSNGAPANQTLIDAVQNHIAPDGKEGGGLAPIGALVSVDAPVQRSINISFSWTLESGYDPLLVQDEVEQAITNYFINVGINGLIRINEIGALIINTEGVADYSGLTVDGGTVNVQLGENEVAVLGTVTIT
jgi:uncharacterized phage protein gp47/JayE